MIGSNLLLYRYLLKVMRQQNFMGKAESWFLHIT